MTTESGSTCLPRTPGFLVSLVPAMLLALVLCGVLIRYGDLNEPPICHGDEALTALRSLGLVEQGHFWTPYWNGGPNLHKPPFYYWFVAAGYRVFGVGELAVRLPSVIFFLLLLVLAYRMVGRFAGPWAGLAAAALLSLHPVLVVQSRTGMMDTLVILLALAGGYSLILARDNPRFFYLWGVAGGLALFTKGGGAILWLPVSLVYLALADRQAFKRFQLYAGLLAALIIPGIWFGHQFLVNREAFVSNYFTHEVAYRVTKDNPLTTLLENRTTIRFWHSLGALGPLAAASAVLVFFIPGPPSTRDYQRGMLLLVCYLVISLLLSNMIAQQMYWYILPAVVPALMLTAILLIGILSGRAPAWVALVACALLLGGTFQRNVCVEGGQVVMWAARSLALAAMASVFLARITPIPLQLALSGGFALALWSGMSFKNTSVNLTNLRDASDLKKIGLFISSQPGPRTPVFVDFEHYPMNALLFYARRNSVYVDEPELLPGQENEFWGVSQRKKNKLGNLKGFNCERVARHGEFTLLRMTRRPDPKFAPSQVDGVPSAR